MYSTDFSLKIIPVICVKEGVENMWKVVTICSSNFACLQYFKFFTTSTFGPKLKEYSYALQSR